MRKVISLFGALALVLAMSVPGSAAPQPNVEICHYPGHRGPVSDPTDWFVKPPGYSYCNSSGGQVITVNMNGAVNGHGATAPN